MKNEDNKRAFSALSLAISISFGLAIHVGLCFLGGQWLDRYFGTYPWFTIIGLVLGIFSWFWSSYKRAMKS